MKIAIIDSAYDYNINTPYNKPLGGTQSAICYFISMMNMRGHMMYLYNNIKNSITIDNVNIIPYDIIHDENFDIVIVSCNINDLITIKMRFNNSNTLYCLWTGHDIDQPISKLLENNMMKDMVDIYIFVSTWQQKRYIEKYNIKFNKTIVMRNGIGKPFEMYLNLPSNKIKNSMTYCSVPWRGLALLNPIYMKIKEKHDVSLKIFSGNNIYNESISNENISNENMSNENIYSETISNEKLHSENEKKLEGFDDTNIIYNYGVNQQVLARELYIVEYLTYPNIFPETSCITILQAMACGCIVITSDLGALKESMNNMNFYIDINLYNFNVMMQKEYIDKFVDKLNDIMILPEEIKEIIRNKNREYIKQNYLWKNITKEFEDNISIILKQFREYSINRINIITDATKDFSNNNYIISLNKYNSILYYYNLSEYYLIILNMGACYFNLNQMDKAIFYFKIAKSIKDDFNVNKNLAAIYLQSGNTNKFLKYGRMALNFEFDIFIASLMCEVMNTEGYYHECIGLYEKILHLDPTNITCLNNLGNLYLLFISQNNNITDDMNKTYNKSLKIAHHNNDRRKMELVVSNIIFNDLYNWKLTEEEIYNNSFKWHQYITRNSILQSNSKHHSNIHIGYISTDFCTHPVGFMFESILKNHNTNKFKIFCYDNSGKSTDSLNKRLRYYNNATWYDIDNISDMDVIAIMIENDLDILVDMMGHTRNNRLNILQYKPARIQVSYFAYPGTSGIKEIDYKITDIYASPPETQKYFIEKFCYMPNGFQCYTPPFNIESKKNYEHRNSKYSINLCCFNNPIKLSIPTIDTFCEILKRLPEAKLYLRYCYYKSSFYRASIIKMFTDRNIDKERIDINNDNLTDCLSLYNMMDIALDPFPYNGGTISSEALYMNTPLITLAGTSYVSRVGVSLLSNMNLEQHIAYTMEEYIIKVIDLARNMEELHELHSNIRTKMLTTDLGNSKSFTNNLEILYNNMINNTI